MTYEDKRMLRKIYSFVYGNEMSWDNWRRYCLIEDTVGIVYEITSELRKIKRP